MIATNSLNLYQFEWSIIGLRYLHCDAFMSHC